MPPYLMAQVGGEAWVAPITWVDDPAAVSGPPTVVRGEFHKADMPPGKHEFKVHVAPNDEKPPVR